MAPGNRFIPVLRAGVDSFNIIWRRLRPGNLAGSGSDCNRGSASLCVARSRFRL